METLLQEYDFKLLNGVSTLIGIDEVGRGALAGPVFTAACGLNQTLFKDKPSLARTSIMRDSKKMSEKKRMYAFLTLMELKEKGLIDYTITSASVEEIDQRNILGATLLSMERSLSTLIARINKQVDYMILVDGKPLPPSVFPFKHKAIVGGDDRSLSIAMASILAKVSRDTYMKSLDNRFSGYGFSQNKGYGTKRHKECVLTKGPCPAHRPLFLRKILKSV
tara:strand:+ start:726 stop:1391 length:666 start_codon:yes stop_codon:yes gene_type:complete